MSKVVVLLSSGLDSTVNLYAAKKEHDVALALTFNYGQRAAKKEVQRAVEICKELQVLHKVLELGFFKDFGRSSLLVENQTIPSGAEVSIDDHETSLKSAKSVWVPNRNGVFLNIGAGFAESLDAQYVIPGFNKEEAATFPDNSQEFLDKTTAALALSTSNQVQIKCFTTRMNKTEIVKEGAKLGVNWSLLWPCYHSYEKWCGSCESCQRFKRAAEAAQVPMPGVWL